MRNGTNVVVRTRNSDYKTLALSQFLLLWFTRPICQERQRRVETSQLNRWQVNLVLLVIRPEWHGCLRTSLGPNQTPLAVTVFLQTVYVL